MQRETEKAIKQIAKELSKLNRIVAVIGQAFIGKKVTQLKDNSKEFKKIVEQRRDVT